MYPYGDSQSDKTLSVFLCAVDRKQLPGWSQTAHYQITVVSCHVAGARHVLLIWVSRSTRISPNHLLIQDMTFLGENVIVHGAGVNS